MNTENLNGVNMNKEMIEFEFEGEFYEVDLDAKEKNIILLPDGRYLHATGWITVKTPIPLQFTIISPLNGAIIAKKLIKD